MSRRKKRKKIVLSGFSYRAFSRRRERKDSITVRKFTAIPSYKPEQAMFPRLCEGLLYIPSSDSLHALNISYRTHPTMREIYDWMIWILSGIFLNRKHIKPTNLTLTFYIIPRRFICKNTIIPAKKRN